MTVDPQEGHSLTCFAVSVNVKGFAQGIWFSGFYDSGQAKILDCPKQHIGTPSQS